jgi:hypothetical protein
MGNFFLSCDSPCIPQFLSLRSAQTAMFREIGEIVSSQRRSFVDTVPKTFYFPFLLFWAVVCGRAESTGNSLGDCLSATKIKTFRNGKARAFLADLHWRQPANQ